MYRSGSPPASSRGRDVPDGVLAHVGRRVAAGEIGLRLGQHVQGDGLVDVVADAAGTLDKTVALVNANFRLFRVPLVWLPYANAPAGRKVRQSGFLIPDVGQSSRKGFILGDAFYLAPTPWMDATIGGQYMSRRGLLERGSFRAKPFENTSIEYSYFGVDDRGM